MAVNSRQNNLFAAEDWDVAYQAYTQVDLQAYDFDTIRSAMVEYIKTNFPENFNDYIESSEFIAIIELLAYLGQSIAFRMDINTRENFLETAERRDSVFKLARMLGYNPKRNIPKWYPGLASRFAMRFLVKKSQKYGSAFCFRITEVIDNDMEDYLKLIESLFTDRKVIYVGPIKGKNSEIPEFLKPLEFLQIPEKNAFEKFQQILKEIKELCEKYNNPLVVIVGGTTASAISYELNISNITCYDFGQYFRLYKKFLNSENRLN